MIRPSYMRWAHDNADGTKYFLFSNASSKQLHIYNTADNSLFGIPTWLSHENNEPRWDDNNPNIVYHLDGCKFLSTDIRDLNTSVLIHNFTTEFPSCETILNGGEGTSANGSRFWTWMVLSNYSHGNYFLEAVIVYDKAQNRVIGKLDRNLYIAQGGNAALWDSGGYRPNMVDMAPLGDRVVLLWPSLKYPSPSAVVVNGSSDKTIVSSGGTQVTVQHSAANTTWNVGDVFAFQNCTGGAQGLNGIHTLVAKPSTYTTVFNASGSDVQDGDQYSCSTIQPALVSIEVRAGIATATAGFTHQLQAGDYPTIANAPIAALNTTVMVTGVSGRNFTFNTTVPDGRYVAAARNGMVLRWQEGSHISDNDFRFPELKSSNNAANDGPHVYNLDFSRPVRVCNDETHSGWAFDLTGTQVFVCQINNKNWAQAEADTVGFTNIYTGVYTPVFYHADLDYQGIWHFGRFYNRNIRGWAAMAFTGRPTDNNKLNNNLVFFELKNWAEQPRIWRATNLYNYHYSYDSEAHGALTRNGQTFVWGGNGPGSDSSSPVSTFSAKLPVSWWNRLNFR